MNQTAEDAVAVLDEIADDATRFESLGFPRLVERTAKIIAGLELLRGVADGTHVIVMMEDYETLLEHAKISENIVECETCGAWLDRNDPAVATTDDYTGCWKVAAGQPDNGNNCRSYRSKR